MRYEDRLSTARVEIRMTEDEKETLKEMAARYNMKISEYVRRALDNYTNKLLNGSAT